MPVISVIVPCFNEEESLRLFYRAMKELTLPTDWEYIFVDDGSSDGTVEILRELAAEDDSVRFISFSRNFGKEAALLAGLRAATGDYIVTMDADLQHPPALLGEMYDAVTAGGYDCAAAKRVTRENESKFRSFCVHTFYSMANRISGTKLVDGATDYRLMRRCVRDAVLELGEYSRFTKGIYNWVGFTTRWIEYEDVERVAGVTKWSFVKLLAYSMEAVTAFSSGPLLWAFLPGLGLLGSAGVMLFVHILMAIFGGDAFSPAAVIIMLILLVGGLVLTALGITGRYLGKVYAETQKRPNFIIRETEKGRK